MKALSILAAGLAAALSATTASAAILYSQTTERSSAFCSSCGGQYRGFATLSLSGPATLQSVSYATYGVGGADASISLWSADRSTKLFEQSFNAGTTAIINGFASVSLPDWAVAGGNYLLSVYSATSLTWGGGFGTGSGYQVMGSTVINQGANFAFVLEGVEGVAVPEPAMLGLFGLGAIGLGLARRRRK